MACTLASFRPARAIPGAGEAAEGQTIRLRPAPARVRIVGDEFPETEVWTYNGVEPGPVLRVHQGTPFRVTVQNALPEDTTVH